MSKDPRQTGSDPWKLDQMDVPPQRRDYQPQQHQPMYPGVQQQQQHQIHPQAYSHALSGPESASLTAGGYHHQQQLPPPQIPPQPNHQLPHLHASIPSMSGMNNGMAMSGMGHPMMNMNGSHTSIMQPPQQQPQAPPSLAPVSFTKDGKIYSLEVKQQPVRARMCGFGDKDRRPITPPPCIKLVIRDVATGQELEPSDDTTSFILLVDIWDESGTHEVSLVRHSNSSPAISISAATTAPYPPPVERPYLSLLDPAQLQSYYVSIGDHTTASNLTHLLTPRQQQQQAQAAYQQQQAMAFGGAPVQRGYPQPYPGQPQQHFMPPTIPVPAVMASATTTGMFTKNLIGSLCANATRLNDPDGKPGYWFILQDLSVRTEGNFRLKLSFVDISPMSGSSDAVNKGKVPVLAMTYTETFQVYSAKKFPGVIESTELSKCFAQQGIKIPIRKDGNGRPDINAAFYESETPSPMPVPATPVSVSTMSRGTASRANNSGAPSSKATMSRASAAVVSTVAAVDWDPMEMDENKPCFHTSNDSENPVAAISPTFNPNEQSIFGPRR